MTVSRGHSSCLTYALLRHHQGHPEYIVALDQCLDVFLRVAGKRSKFFLALDSVSVSNALAVDIAGQTVHVALPLGALVCLREVAK